MSADWETLPDGSKRCRVHGAAFSLPMACPMCGPECAAIEVVADESEVIDEQARAMGLPTELEHERAFNTMSRRLWSWAKAARNGEGLDEGGRSPAGHEPNHKAAHNYATEAIKARKAAAFMTANRRDWYRYNRAARLALGIKAGSPQDRALSDALRTESGREAVRN